MKESFQNNGFFRSKINPLTLSTSKENDINIIKENFKNLPMDPYAKAENNRFRAYSNLIILPWEKEIKWIPVENYSGSAVSSYWQGAFNNEYTDEVRQFTPISSEAKNSTLLKNLILHDFDMTFWNKKDIMSPIYVGIHFIKLLVINKDQKAFSSPNLVHRDGEAFTFAHLFNRTNLKGGTNYISKPEYANYRLEDIAPKDILDKFEMYETLDTYGVCDELVSHYVSPVELEDHNKLFGSREIILIDFSSLQQVLKEKV